MKKFISAILAICVMMSLAGCSENSGNLKGFLADAEGIWYMYGDSSGEMLKISEGGAWELHEVTESGGDRFISESGGADSIRYDSENKEWNLSGNDKIYICKTTKDGLLIFKGTTFIAAEESRDLSERFDGDWYLDGDRDKDFYRFEAGEWKYWEAIGMGHSSTDGGYLIYRGGDTKELTAGDPVADNPLAVFSIVGDDEIKTKDGGQTYLRLESLDLEDGEEIEDSNIVNFTKAYENDWYDVTTDGERVEMAEEILAIFMRLGHDTSNWTGNTFAQAMNDYYDIDKSQSVWWVACKVFGIDPATY